jgi:DNA-binding CsgD family transcriptional regulator
VRLLAALPRGDERELAAAAETGERFGDADLASLALHEQGSVLIRRGRVAEGLALLDEAMVAVTAGELSPIATGLVYCSVIDGCHRVQDLRRAQEWTAALTRWCERRPDLVAFTGRCLVHRAEILQVHGAWADALEEARQAARRLAGGAPEYRVGEVLRLRGELAAAEQAYRDASQAGGELQPGLALLRLAQGNVDAAVAAIRRATGETGDALRRAELLPAAVEILLAAGETEEARAACEELERLAATIGSTMLGAAAGHARGALALAAGDAGAALAPLRRALAAWQELDAPYEGARARELIGRACLALGDEDSAAFELDAARVAYARLGATPDLERLGAPDAAHDLSPRELQVLRLVASGETNRAIAAQLVLSERTVDRHVSNILAKLRVPSRAAATAYAYEHRLVG